MPRAMLEPMFDRLVVKELDPPDMRASGLMVPVALTEVTPPQEGIVLAVGPGLDWWKQAGVKVPVAVGDHVMFPHQCGTYIELNEERLLVLHLAQLLGVVRDA
jgi:chaperonin GroES